MDTPLISDEKRDEMLVDRPTPNHLTPDSIKATVKDVTFIHEGVLTLAIMTLQNGYVVTGQSACADPANYDADLGNKIAYEDALKKIWPLEGYLLRQRLHEELDASTAGE